MKYLFICAIGPVQEFIATARRSRDLWFGSWLLSELSKAAARKLEEISPGCLVFPSVASRELLETRNEFTAPNKVVAILDVEDAGGVIREAVKERLRSLWKDTAKRIDHEGGKIDEQTAHKQIEDLIEFYWVSVPFDEKNEKGYEDARETSERVLAARKATRNFSQPAWSSNHPKSSLDGARESVIPSGEYPERTDAPDEKNKKIEQLYLRYHARRGEQLSAVDLLKRLGEPGLSPRFKSTSDMAAIPFIEALNNKEEGMGTALLQEIRDLLPDQELLDGAEEGLVFESRFADAFPSQQPAKEKLEAFRKKVKKYGTPNPYYALLAADGDNMGRFIDDLKTADDHRSLSKAMSSFALAAREIVNAKQGVSIYSGGDDVLAYLPLHTVLSCAAELHASFAALMEGVKKEVKYSGQVTPTLSVGISISHHVDPLSEALELARDAERLAKKEKSKDGLAIILRKRSGVDREISGKWGIFDVRLNELVRMYQAEAISAGTAYELQELHRVLSKSSVPPEGVAGEAVRILKRKKEAGGKAEIQTGVLEQFTAWVQNKTISLEGLSREMIVAGMLAGSLETQKEVTA